MKYIPATAMDNPHVTRDYIIELEQKTQGAAGSAAFGQMGRIRRAGFSGVCGRPGALRGRAVHARTSNRSKFHGTGRGWSVSTTDTRGLFFGVWAWMKRGGSTVQGALRLRAGGSERRRDLSAGEIARRLADLMEPEFQEGIHVSGIADPAIGTEAGAERGRADSEGIQRRDLHEGDNTRLRARCSCTSA